MSELEPFLDFERAFEKVISRLWDAELQAVGPALDRAAQAGDTLETDRILSRLDLTEPLAKKLPQVQVLMEASLLFGASLVSGDPRKTALKQDQIAQIVSPALALYENTATFSLSKLVQQRVAQAVSDQNAEPEIMLEVRKADGVASEVAKNTGRMMSSIAANMTTSRLVNYGALFQMSAQGVKTFRLDATLDSRTSSICRRMHGKTYTVETALLTLESILRTTDPEDLKQAAPWIKGDKETLKWLETANEADLRGRGYAVPPFHPLCRTVVRLVSDVVVTGFEYTPLSTLIAGATEAITDLFATPTPE